MEIWKRCGAVAWRRPSMKACGCLATTSQGKVQSQFGVPLDGHEAVGVTGAFSVGFCRGFVPFLLGYVGPNPEAKRRAWEETYQNYPLWKVQSWAPQRQPHGMRRSTRATEHSKATDASMGRRVIVLPHGQLLRQPQFHSARKTRNQEGASFSATPFRLRKPSPRSHASAIRPRSFRRKLRRAHVLRLGSSRRTRNNHRSAG